MAVSPQVLRSRRIRERILHVLVAAHKGLPGAKVEHAQILAAFANDRARFTQEEIEVQLFDLVEDGLLDQENASWGTPPEKLYGTTSQGRDFHLAAFPWDRIDEYTGGQKLGEF